MQRLKLEKQFHGREKTECQGHTPNLKFHRKKKKKKQS